MVPKEYAELAKPAKRFSEVFPARDAEPTIAKGIARTTIFGEICGKTLRRNINIRTQLFVHPHIMSFAAASAWLKQKGLESRIRRFSGSSATAALAAQEIGTTEGAIAKTVALLGPEGPILVVCAGDRKIDNGAFKRLFHFKPRFVPPAEVEALVGHEPGGVCPFGQLSGIPVYADESLKAHDTVWPACGDRTSGAFMTPEELYKASDAVGWCLVTKPAHSEAQP